VKIKVLIIDDSSVIRKVLKEIIDEQPDMTVVGAAPDPVVARDMIRQLNPDVLTLDVEMPKMNGLAFLRRLMRVRPMPVVMLSSYTREGTDLAFRALSLGAVDFVGKPIAGQAGAEDYSRAIVEKIRGAFAARDKIKAPDASADKMDDEDLADEALTLGEAAASHGKVIVMAGSTGGPEVVQHILQRMPGDCPGILIVQQMPAGFTEMFAKRLDDLCFISVSQAKSEEPVLPGHAYIAPGDAHMTLVSHGARGYGIALNQQAPVNGARPSADVLFRSAAAAAGKDGIGVILTGAGRDGAEGLLEMKKASAFTIAQDEATSVVFGMPKEAIALGGASEVLPLKMISRRVLAYLGHKPGGTGSQAT
jgi:two-component system chemotaxis response regulator CheB